MTTTIPDLDTVLPDTTGVTAIRVKRDAFSDAGIADGDIVILRKTDTVTDGGAFALVVRADETVVIRLVRLTEEGITLVPEAVPAAAHTFSPDDFAGLFRVTGKVIAVIRHV